jgi:nicotinate-nucleotide adenylyltransferase
MGAGAPRPLAAPRRLTGPAWAGRRIGLLGGSFNPAHDGHLFISRQALRRLGLDEVWWLVSPQNPLKPVRGMAPLPERLAGAAAAARHPRLRVAALETELGTRFTIDTLRALKRRYPRTRFVWLIGADNLAQLPRWRAWSQILSMVPVAVFPRGAYSLRALGGKVARRFSRRRVDPGRAYGLARRKPPAWTFLTGPLHPASATEIRRLREGVGAGPGNLHR